MSLVTILCSKLEKKEEPGKSFIIGMIVAGQSDQKTVLFIPAHLESKGSLLDLVRPTL